MTGAPKLQSGSNHMLIKLLNVQAQRKQRCAVIVFYLLFIEKIGYSKFVRQTEGRLQQEEAGSKGSVPFCAFFGHRNPCRGL
jgi:hypothetical protein